MKPEILLKAYVSYESEDAFRELVADTVDAVYSTSLRIVQGASPLAGEAALCVYLELARKSPGLLRGEVVLDSWLRQRTCQMAVRILRAEGRPIDWKMVKKEKNALPTPADVQPAPSGLAIRICQSVFLSTRHRGRGFFLPRGWWPAGIRPAHIGGALVGLLMIFVWWHNPFHRPNPIIRSEAGPPLTPSSYAQLAGPDEVPVITANPNAVTNINQK